MRDAALALVLVLALTLVMTCECLNEGVRLGLGGRRRGGLFDDMMTDDPGRLATAGDMGRCTSPIEAGNQIAG